MEAHILTIPATIRQALEQLNSLSGSEMTLLITDSEGHMLGTLTDGDVRRALLRGTGLDADASVAMHRDFKALSANKIDIEALRRYRQRGITLVPVLHTDGTIARVIDTRRTRTVLPLSAILMAGGKGERLRPLTLDCPKPLLKVGQKPIIDYNIDALMSVGITDISVMVNYLAPMLEEHFSASVHGVQVKTVREPQFMGTIGAAALVPHAEGGDTIVMNSDLLTTVSFEDMYLTHVHEGADITMAVVPYNVSVPYAILTTEGRCVRGLEEKPSYSYFANAGIYIFNNEILDKLPREGRTDAPDLIEQAIAEGRKVVYHPIDGTWIDIGSPTDFAHAQELMQLANGE